MSDHRDHRHLRRGLGFLLVGDHGHPFGAQHVGLQHEPFVTDLDRLGAPLGDALCRGHDQQAGRAVETGAQGGHVHRPAQPLAIIGAELHLDHDRKHRLALEQQDHQVGAVLGRDDLGEVDRLLPDLIVLRHLHIERLLQHLRGQIRTIAEQIHQGFVQHRRHGASIGARPLRQQPQLHGGVASTEAMGSFSDGPSGVEELLGLGDGEGPTEPAVEQLQIATGKDGPALPPQPDGAV